MEPLHVIQARASQWANGLLYALLAKLPAGELVRPLGVNFGSILALADHTILADQAWLARFTGGQPVTPATYVPHADFAALCAARKAEDERINAFAQALDPARLAGTLRYHNLKGEPREQPFALCLAHFFNHQTFHRGQLHALLGERGENPPDLDLIFFAAQRTASA